MESLPKIPIIHLKSTKTSENTFRDSGSEETVNETIENIIEQNNNEKSNVVMYPNANDDHFQEDNAIVDENVRKDSNEAVVLNEDSAKLFQILERWDMESSFFDLEGSYY